MYGLVFKNTKHNGFTFTHWLFYLFITVITIVAVGLRAQSKLQQPVTDATSGGMRVTRLAESKSARVTATTHRCHGDKYSDLVNCLIYGHLIGSLRRLL